MKKQVLAMAATMALPAALLLTLSAKNGAEEYRTALTKDGKGIVRTPSPCPGFRGPLTELPSFNPGDRDPWRVDLRGYDLSALNLKGRISDLLYASFDDQTKWPENLPEEFDPAMIMETGKNPGLEVRGLHKSGITGKGVGIAVIDMGFLVDHVEYKDRLRLFEEIHSADETAQMHGVATASIAVGKTVGVAPEADLYYIAHFPAQDDGTDSTPSRDFTWTTRCIDRILEVNRSLPQNRKIRVISLSIGWNPKETGYDEMNQAVERAKQDGVFVICTTMTESFGFRIFGLGRDPMKNPDEVASYSEAWWGGFPGEGVLNFPMDSRTTASPTGTEDYAFYRLGGLSWSVPWAAGLYALACQIRPDITPWVFWSTALETGDALELPPKEPQLSEEEIENRVEQMIENRMAQLKSRLQGKTLEEALGEVYTKSTGKTVEKMSEADFRAWGAGPCREEVLRSTKPRPLGKVINPARLIQALQKED